MRELIVALVAGRGPDHVARRGRTAGRYEVESSIVVERSQVELGQVAVAVDADAMGGGAILAGRYLVAVGVDILAVADLLPRAAGIRGAPG